MSYRENRRGNIIAFMTSLVIHIFAVSWLYAVTSSYDTLLSKQKEAQKSLAINLNQISANIDSKNELQASQQQAVLPQPKSETEPTAETEKPQIKEPEPKSVKKEKPKKKILEQKSAEIKPKKIKQKPIKTALKQDIKTDEPMQVKEPQPKDLQSNSDTKTPPASQNLAGNESVLQGGTKQLGQSSSLQAKSASTVLGEVYSAILKHKTYPKRAINSAMEGKVEIEFLLSGRCEFEFLRVVRGSGYEFLDRHGLGIIQKACKDFPDEAIKMSIKSPIVFNIKQIN